MGAAAYNRGTKTIASQLDREARPTEFAMMEALNAMPKFPGASKPFGDVVFIAGHGGWWAECPVTGFGYHYSTLRDAVRSFRVRLHTYDRGRWVASPQ